MALDQIYQVIQNIGSNNQQLKKKKQTDFRMGSKVNILIIGHRILNNYKYHNQNIKKDGKFDQSTGIYLKVNYNT